MPNNNASKTSEVASPQGVIRHRTERIIEVLLFACGFLSIVTTVGIIFVLSFETIGFFKEVSLVDFLGDTRWTPLFAEKHFGIWALVSGTVLTTVIAISFALPLGLLAAIYLSEFAGPRVRSVLKPSLELLAGIPSIVYGYFALVFLTPILQMIIPGLRLTHRLKKDGADEIVERSLRQAALWDEVKDRLEKPGFGLSGGQQQRLCIARALAVDPEVLLMDEPCSALDPIATARIEDLVHSLSGKYTIVIVTHNMQQAARVSSRTAFFLMGDLVEFDETDRLFTSPSDSRTEDYITGKFG